MSDTSIIETQRRTGLGRWLAVWLAFTASAAALLGLVHAATRAPEPVPDGGPRGPISEARVRRIAHHLTEEIGVRVAGTEACDRAADYLRAQLGQIPGLEVELHRAAGEALLDARLYDYRVRNVVARLPGRRADAILLVAHHDTPPESVGAADDAISVGALVEVARILAAGDQLEQTVIFLFDGGEEAGLLGAHGFLDHPWASSVRAFVNLEAAGVSGPPILFQAGPGAPWLAEAYAGVPRPLGTSLGQDLFGAGLIPSDTSGAVFREAGWPGLDVALFEGGYLYHTLRDRLEHVEPGSAQGIADNTLAVTRALAGAPLPAGEAVADSPVFFDVLGATMLVYSPGAALVLALAGLVLLFLAVFVAARRGAVTVGSVAVGAGLAVTGLVVGLIAAAAVGFVVADLLGEPLGWYARHGLAAIAFGGGALAGFAAPQAIWSARRARAERPRERTALAAFAGAAALQCALSLAAAIFDVASGYVFTIGAMTGAIAIGLAAFAPARARWIPLALAWLVEAAVVFQLGLAVTRMFVPIAGRMEVGGAIDALIAVVVALPVLLAALAAVPALHWAGRPGWTVGALGVATLVGAGLSALAFPYTRDEPKRLDLDQVEVARRPAELRLVAWDDLAPDEIGLTADVAARAGLALRGEGIAAAPSGGPPPSVTVVPGPAGAERRVTIEVAPGDHHELRFDLPRDRVAGWSLRTPLDRMTGDRLLWSAIGVHAIGYRIELELRGAAPVPLVVEGRSLAHTPAVQRVLAALPEWATGVAMIKRRVELSL